MSSLALYEELDIAVDAMLRGKRRTGRLDPVVESLTMLGDELRAVPDPQFREGLRIRLAAEGKRQHEEAAGSRHAETKVVPISGKKHERNWEHQVFPSWFKAADSTYSFHRSPYVASALLHAAGLALVLTTGYWAVGHRQEVEQRVVSLVGGPNEYRLSVAKERAGGGGGGGDHDRLSASQGAASRFAKEQIVPPAVVIRNDNPKLTVEATVVGPPEIELSKSAKVGDPLSTIFGPASNGTGSGGGIGTGTGGGVGSGSGPGVGPGHGGGYGGGAYRVGGGVSAPRAIYAPDPEYSEEARKAKYQGTVLLWLVVGPDGRSRDVRVQRSLGMGLDEQAVEAVRQWRFAPALKDGHPVPVQIYVEVNFRLY